ILDVAMDEETGNNPYLTAEASIAPNIVNDKLIGFKIILYTFRGDGYTTVENMAHEAFIHGWKAPSVFAAYELNGINAAREAWSRNDPKGDAGHRALLMRDISYEGYRQYDRHNKELMSAFPKLAPTYQNYLKTNYKTRYFENYK